jgi:hypothetical protein
MNPSIIIDSDFPGGNIVVEKIAGEEVFLRQDLRDTHGDWFYWAFRVRGAALRRLTFHFTGGDVIGVRGAATSPHGGGDWRWLGDVGVVRSASEVAFSHHFGEGEDETFFALCPLYTQCDLDRYLAQPRAQVLQRSVLCRSRSGREVELLRYESSSARINLLLTARHHACETMASFVLEGVLDAALGSDELGVWLRTNVNIAAVPFMDKDGVEQGDQGKNRMPYDHNRDYGGALSGSIYPEVAALRKWAPAFLESEKFNFSLDLHCPWIRGDGNEQVYFVGVPDPEIWRRVQRFSDILEKGHQGQLPHDKCFNIPFGVGWNVRDIQAPGACSCSKWLSTLPHIHWASTLETPYANAGGAEVSPQNCRALGRDLMTALQEYILSLP